MFLKSGEASSFLTGFDIQVQIFVSFKHWYVAIHPTSYTPVFSCADISLLTTSTGMYSNEIEEQLLWFALVDWWEKMNQTVHKLHEVIRHWIADSYKVIRSKRAGYKLIS